MAAITGYYIQRLSDGKILLGNGPNTQNVYDFIPGNWGTLTGTQLDSAYWCIVDTTQPFRTYEYILSNVIDAIAQPNGSWGVDMYRLLSIVRNP